MFGLGIPLLLVLATLGGYLLARQSLTPVAVMTERAAQISAKTLNARLPVANPGDELGRLASVFNELLARVEKLQHAVKFAREEANDHAAEEQKIGRTVLDYLFA